MTRVEGNPSAVPYWIWYVPHLGAGNLKERRGSSMNTPVILTRHNDQDFYDGHPAEQMMVPAFVTCDPGLAWDGTKVERMDTVPKLLGKMPRGTLAILPEGLRWR